MSRPVFTYDNAPPELIRELSLMVGYLVHMAGGTVTIPKLSDVSAMLEDRWALDNTVNADHSITVTLTPISKVPGLEDSNARTN